MKAYKIKSEALEKLLKIYKQTETEFTFCEYLYYIHGISISKNSLYKDFFEENNIEYKDFVPNKEDSEQIVKEFLFNI